MTTKQSEGNHLLSNVIEEVDVVVVSLKARSARTRKRVVIDRAAISAIGYAAHPRAGEWRPQETLARTSPPFPYLPRIPPARPVDTGGWPEPSPKVSRVRATKHEGRPKRP